MDQEVVGWVLVPAVRSIVRKQVEILQEPGVAVFPILKLMAGGNHLG